MSDKDSFVEIWILFEKELKRDVLVILGVFWENMLNVQQIAESFLILLSDIVNKRTVWEYWVPITIDDFTFHVVLDIFIWSEVFFGVRHFFLSERGASDDFGCLWIK